MLFYNKALALKPNYVPALNNLGVMYVLEKDFSRALVAFKRARKISDFSRTPRFNLANLYLNFGLYNKSIYHAKTLYKNGMKDVDVLNMLATSHLMRSEAKLAISYFQQIESDFLEEARFGVNYAFALFNVGNKEKAKDVLDDVSGKMNKHWKAYYNEVAKLIGVNK
ncbi:MAG: hypothetical protein HON90_15095 [Halobacteriovoraceae bacterium]|nr:hypothetical protein [Halobacteriovoraceae bacterium]